MTNWLKVAKQKAILFALISFVLFGFTACLQKSINTNHLTPPAKTQPTSISNPFYQFNLKQSFGNGIVEAVDWAPDGSTFALATSLKVDLYSAETLEAVTTLDTGQWNME
jgi:hypothetical protein